MSKHNYAAQTDDAAGTHMLWANAIANVMVERTSELHWDFLYGKLWKFLVISSYFVVK